MAASQTQQSCVLLGHALACATLILPVSMGQRSKTPQCRLLTAPDCSLLGDVSVVALATYLPKLRRIGLVKVRDLPGLTINQQVTNVTNTAIQSLAQRSATLERVHLSYCEKITVPAVAYLLNRLPHLTHLSVTGIAAFRTPELQQFCRMAPEVMIHPSDAN